MNRSSQRNQESKIGKREAIEDRRKDEGSVTVNIGTTKERKYIKATNNTATRYAGQVLSKEAQ